MSAPFQFTPQATEDIDGIWWFVTPLPVRFWTVTRFPNYVIVYRPETVPLQVIAILHGKRDLKEVLEGRPL
jgi:plasmid stabilization system protein ParE